MKIWGRRVATVLVNKFGELTPMSRQRIKMRADSTSGVVTHTLTTNRAVSYYSIHIVRLTRITTLVGSLK